MNRYGWVRDLPDYRDNYYEPPKLAELPSSTDYRNELPAVYDQGTIGSCTAQAIAAMIQYNEKKQKLVNNLIPSRLFMYYNSRLIQHTEAYDSGTSMRLAIRSISTYGYCREDVWPYDESKFKTKPNKAAYRFAGTHKVIQYARIGQDINLLKTTLASGNLFAFGFTAYSNFESDEVRTTGILTVPEASDTMLGGHAVLAVGYDDSEGMLLVRNSWGPTWGLGGYFKMSYTYLSDPNLAADFWTITAFPLPIEDQKPPVFITNPPDPIVPQPVVLPPIFTDPNSAPLAG